MKDGKAILNEDRIGILDSRIKVEHGLSFLQGFLIASFGSQILTRKLDSKKLNYKFFIDK
jgi:hypothetical protein